MWIRQDANCLIKITSHINENLLCLLWRKFKFKFMVVRNIILLFGKGYIMHQIWCLEGPRGNSMYKLKQQAVCYADRHGRLSRLWDVFSLSICLTVCLYVCLSLCCLDIFCHCFESVFSARNAESRVDRFLIGWKIFIWSLFSVTLIPKVCKFVVVVELSLPYEWLLSQWTFQVPVVELGGARCGMVIVAGYGHGNTSSIPVQDWLHFT